MDRDSIGRKRIWTDDISDLLRLLAGSDVEELDVEHGGARVVVRRDPTGPIGLEPRVAAISDASSAEPIVVASPLVGLFRRSTGATTEPPIDEGDTVAVGQAVGSVEAMRMLNRVQSEHAGVVERLLVQDGEPVEYGQPLLTLRPL